MRTVDTKTRYQGVFARHQTTCGLLRDRRCDCDPSYYGVAYDRRQHRHRKTKRFRVAVEARDARADLLDSLLKGAASRGSAMRFDDARRKFVAAAREGVVLNKWGRRYRRRAVDDLESALARIPDDLARRRLKDVSRGDIQELADELSRKGLSGSRIRSVINAVRSLYRWAQERELVGQDPAARVRLPAVDARPRDRVATPSEFAELLSALGRPTPRELRAGKSRSSRDALRDSVPFALAAYATARSQEIRVLDWSHVNLEVGAAELAADEEGRKPGGSWRIVPLVAPVRAILRREWMAQGRPKKGKVCPPRKNSRSGLISLDHVQERVHKRWRELELQPIGLHEARHTAATWLDHAGVSPKVASQIMGHKTSEYQPGAARITLERYTHVLPGELERGRELLDTFLAERVIADGAAVRQP
jgi:integrase